jgi:hypothetical protein
MRLPRLREINRVVAFDDCTGRILEPCFQHHVEGRFGGTAKALEAAGTEIEHPHRSLK